MREADLFENAINSLQLGIEDFESNDARRVLSAVRNFYSGTLLLAKGVLVRAVPGANPEEVIGAHYKPIPDGQGGVKYEQASQQTIDLDTIGRRFSDFKLTIDHAALRSLNKIRNEIEHLYTQQPREVMRETIAKTFAVVAHLFRLAEEDPRKALGAAWATMLEVRDVYERELEACTITFARVEWGSSLLEAAPRVCPKCHSELVAQDDAENSDRQSLQSTCRACGEKISGEALVEGALEQHLAGDNYRSVKDGGDGVLHSCPECGIDAYITEAEETGCLWCGFVLGDCGRCQDSLTPDTVSSDDSSLCSYCDYVMSKDD